MKLFKKKSLHNISKRSETGTVESNFKKSIREMNFEEYIGQTITVYVNAGGLVGNGFTGVLMWYSSMSIRLLVIPVTPPSCSLGNACKSNTDKFLFCLSCPYNKNATMGSIAEIPFSSVVAFVHNNLRL